MNVTLTVSVKTTGGITGFWLAVDDDDVVIAGGKGTVAAPANAECILHYWLVGDEGGRIEIAVEQGAGNVRLETQETIPPDFTKAAGHYLFRTN
jgi:hypothetical protein